MRHRNEVHRMKITGSIFFRRLQGREGHREEEAAVYCILSPASSDVKSSPKKQNRSVYPDPAGTYHSSGFWEKMEEEGGKKWS